MRRDHLFGSGANNPRAKLTEADVVKFLGFLAEGFNTPGAAHLAGISVSAGKDIRHGRTWKHVPRTSHPLPATYAGNAD